MLGVGSAGLTCIPVIEPVYFYLDPQTMGNTQKIQDTLAHFTALKRWESTLQKNGDH